MKKKTMMPIMLDKTKIELNKNSGSILAQKNKRVNNIHHKFNAINNGNKSNPISSIS